MVTGEPVALLVTFTVPLALPVDVGLKATLKVKLCEGVRVTGTLAPLSVNAVALMLICEIWTLEFPVLVIVTVCVAELPVFTFPNPMLVVLNESVCVAVVPVPLNGNAAGEFGALLTIETLPVTAPAEAGKYCTLNVLEAPGLSDTGKLSPLVLKPLPATPTWLIVNTPVPLLLTFTVCVLAVPTGTLPKLTLVGVSASPACTPVPLIAITELDPCELMTVTFPVTLSAAVGLKATFIDFACPGVSSTGVVIPLVFTSFALTVICEIVTFAFPVLVTVTLLELVLPALMLPKARLAGLAVRVTDAATPVPVKVTLAGELGALLEIFTVPLRLPAVAGANSALNDAL